MRQLCASPTLNDGASSTALMIVNVGLVHNDLCASPTLNDGASSTALVIVNVGLFSQRPVCASPTLFTTMMVLRRPRL